MDVLIACEESQRVCIEFRKLGHRAFSCDVVNESGGFPCWHIKQDVIPLLNGHCEFKTRDGKLHHITKEWDLIIAHPPCTYLTVTGNRWFDVDKYGDKARERIIKRNGAYKFFMKFVRANCEHIAIENPIGFMNTHYRKPDQIIHPYMFGDPQRKATCLWLKGLKPLKSTNIVEPKIIKYKNGKGTDNPWHVDTMTLPPAKRARERSKTFPGIAKAMATQWSNI